MNINEYEKQFDEILEGKNTAYPYDSDEYTNYVKLNKARMKRWAKVGKIAPELVETLKNIQHTPKLDFNHRTLVWRRCA